MALEKIQDAPASDAFTPLAEHQSHTPVSFFDAKPVLHYRCSDCRLLLSGGQDTARSHFPLLSAKQSTTVNGDGKDQDESNAWQDIVPSVDVWVTSERLILHSATAKSGISIPYPSISLHAIQSMKPPQFSEDTQSLYMQLSINETENINSEDDFETLELNIIPSPATTTASTENSSAAAAAGVSAPPNLQDSPIRQLFSAVSACADLHPDPDLSSQEGDGEADVDAAPGAGGWITSENMHEYFDENGQFVGGGGQNEGIAVSAGTVRARVEDEDGEDQEEGKWQRTG